MDTLTVMCKQSEIRIEELMMELSRLKSQVSEEERQREAKKTLDVRGRGMHRQTESIQGLGCMHACTHTHARARAHALLHRGLCDRFCLSVCQSVCHRAKW